MPEAEKDCEALSTSSPVPANPWEQRAESSTRRRLGPKDIYRVVWGVVVQHDRKSTASESELEIGSSLLRELIFDGGIVVIFQKLAYAIAITWLHANFRP